MRGGAGSLSAHSRAALSLVALCVLVSACAGRSNRVLTEEFGKAELDNFIVPGARAGPVSIGMSEAALRQVMGRPLQTQDSETQRIHEFPQLSVVVARRTRTVEMVIVPGPHYKTEEGITVGAAESAVERAHGRPAKRTGSASTYLNACYWSGIVFNYQKLIVDNIVVRSPGC
jgi:hypothetical protein